MCYINEIQLHGRVHHVNNKSNECDTNQGCDNRMGRKVQRSKDSSLNQKHIPQLANPVTDRQLPANERAKNGNNTVQQKNDADVTLRHE